jgi:hypothetical protein
VQDWCLVLLAQVPERALADGAQKTMCMEKRLKKSQAIMVLFRVEKIKSFHKRENFL